MIATRLYIVCAALLVASVSAAPPKTPSNAATRACAKGFTQWCVTPPPKRDDVADLVNAVAGTHGTIGADGDVFGEHGTVGPQGPVFGEQDIAGSHGPVANELGGAKRDDTLTSTYEGVEGPLLGFDGVAGDNGALFGQYGAAGRKGPLFGSSDPQ